MKFSVSYQKKFLSLPIFSPEPINEESGSHLDCRKAASSGKKHPKVINSLNNRITTAVSKLRVTLKIVKANNTPKLQHNEMIKLHFCIRNERKLPIFSSSTWLAILDRLSTLCMDKRISQAILSLIIFGCNPLLSFQVAD